MEYILEQFEIKMQASNNNGDRAEGCDVHPMSKAIKAGILTRDRFMSAFEIHTRTLICRTE